MFLEKVYIKEKLILSSLEFSSFLFPRTHVCKYLEISSFQINLRFIAKIIVTKNQLPPPLKYLTVGGGG